MPSAEVEAKKLRAKDTSENGRTPTWPPCEPLTKLQLRTFPMSLKRRLRVLAAQQDWCMAETLARVVAAGLEIVDNSGKKAENPAKMNVSD